MKNTLPRLISYQHVPAGFEIVINENSLYPGSGGGIWNLWWNVQLSDDPAVWDREIRALNTMQKEIGPLTSDQRHVRIHMAELCRNSDTFPTSLDILCAEIGAEKITTPWNFGCEGRNLRETLGIAANPDDRLEQRVFLFNSYQIAFSSWIHEKEPENLFEAKVLNYLGDINRNKVELVNALRKLVNPALPSTNSLRDLYIEETRRYFGEPLRQCLNCGEIADIINNQCYPGCSCCERFYIDTLLLVSKFIEPNEMYREMFRYHQECLLGYMFAINSWLIEEESTLVTDVMSPIFLNQQMAKQIPIQVKRLLGERSQVKEWLAGCMLKTMRSNRSLESSTQIIDDFPEASSWLSFIRI
ncbi:MAG: hypothetical protein ACFFEV_03675 [Candidatus Thorarchaeota archaeon]